MVNTAPRRRRRKKFRFMSDLISTLAVLTATGFVVSQGRGCGTTVPVPSDPIDLSGAARKGSTAASLVLVIFSDFQCPYCARFAQTTWPVIDKRFVETGRLRVAFVHLPLRIHPDAVPAAVAAECAGRQGQFWGMHDLLFERSPSLGAGVLLSHASTLRLDIRRFEACQTDAGVLDFIARTREWTNQMGIHSTPTLYLGVYQDNGQIKVKEVLNGAVPTDSLTAAIEAHLATRWSSPVVIGAVLVSVFAIIAVAFHWRWNRR